jgi:hypothetical protein
MRPLRAGLLVLVALGLPATGPAADKPEDYLTKAGLLTDTLSVTDLQGGFAGFTGRKITVEPSGKWTIATVFNRKEEVKASGELNAKQIADLAKELARFELRSLPDEGRPVGANPHIVTVAFGKRQARLVLRTGAPVPPADAATVPGRFGGIARAVEAVARPAKKP